MAQASQSSSEPNEWKYIKGWGGKWSNTRIYVQSCLTATLIYLSPYIAEIISKTLLGGRSIGYQADKDAFFMMAILWTAISFSFAYTSRILLDFKARIEKLENK